MNEEPFYHDLKWDGEERLDRMLIDCLGAEDCEQSRDASWFIVSSVFQKYEFPEKRFVHNVILSGPFAFDCFEFLALLSLGHNVFDIIASGERQDLEYLKKGNQCILISDIPLDDNGNCVRRFAPIPVKGKKKPFPDRYYFEQVWAEAYNRFPDFMEAFKNGS